MTETPKLLSTGIAGLDDILHGGLAQGGLYAVEGDTGAGKTTLGLEFLIAGREQGERGIFVTLSESTPELRAMAASHGWDLAGIDILDLIASEEALAREGHYTMFHPSEVELTETTRAILDAAERIKPTRVVLDSMGELRMLAQSPLRYRRQVVALKQFFSSKGITVLLVDDPRAEVADLAIASIASGIMTLDREATEYGAFRRRLQVLKMRGREVREGYHDFRIRKGGLEVYPRLIAAEHLTSYARESVKSGLQELDDLLGGGLARGTSSLFLGPAGTGKSSLAAQYARAAAGRGDHAAIFLFDESIATFIERSKGLGFDVLPLLESGKLTLRQIDPAELSPGEFAHYVRSTVEQHDTRVVVIDSLTGYLNAMPNERLLALHLHELLTFLGGRGVTSIMLMAQHGIIGVNAETPVDASYLADTVLLLRFFETRGEVSIAVSVIKKRTGRHERTIRELRFVRGAITIGPPITEFTGVLAGVPQLITSGPERATRAVRTKKGDA
ncbi:MAG TPA: ATPase domain-containing protein [Gemmatimonadales bacterium]|nr:ATPase domain-containing protein [Gemmatimonadales bacterium]